MKKLLQLMTIAIAFIGISVFQVQAAEPLDPENTIYMDLKSGRVIIKLRPDLAPNHVQRIKELTREGFYDNLTFHRVIEGFMAQGGDPTGTGGGDSDKPNLMAEFSPSSRAKHVRGVLSMARTDDPNSANCQFFIMLAPAPHLDGKYSIWGQVVKGMKYVDKIEKRGRGGIVANPDKILKMQVAADAAE